MCMKLVIPNSFLNLVNFVPLRAFVSIFVGCLLVEINETIVFFFFTMSSKK